jgi:hypothetical protein
MPYRRSRNGSKRLLSIPIRVVEVRTIASNQGWRPPSHRNCSGRPINQPKQLIASAAEISGLVNLPDQTSLPPAFAMRASTYSEETQGRNFGTVTRRSSIDGQIAKLRQNEPVLRSDPKPLPPSPHRSPCHGHAERAVAKQRFRRRLRVVKRHRADALVALGQPFAAVAVQLHLHQLPRYLGRGVEA